MIEGELPYHRPPRPNPPLPNKHQPHTQHAQVGTLDANNPWGHSEIHDDYEVELGWNQGQQQSHLNHQHQEASFFQHEGPQQFFSDIDKPLFEDDSLFDCPDTFLAPPYPLQKDPAPYPVKWEQFQAKQRESQKARGSRKSLKQQCQQSKNNKSSKLLKEQTYAYRKDKTPSNQPVKMPPPKSLLKQSKNMKEGRSVSATNLRAGKKIQQTLEQEDKTPEGWERTGGEGLLIEEYLQLALERSGIEYGSKSQSRLSQGRKGYESQDIKQCTFKPSILKKSQQLVKNTQPVVERLSVSQARSTNRLPYQPNQHKSRISSQRLQRLSQPRKLKTLPKEQEEQTPSFWPALSKKSLQHMSNCTMDVATRNQLWLEQKQAKIDRLRQEQEDCKAKKDNCTYAPALTNYRGQQDANFSRFGKQGMLEYFQRISKKRIPRQQPSQSRLLTQGDSGRNKENSANWGNSSKGEMVQKGKKQTYQQAVRDLHSKIMKLNI